MENEFPPNSHEKRETRPERAIAEKAPAKKEVVRVTKGKVIVRKKPLYKQFFESFRPADNKGFVEYALLDVLAPGLKDAMADAASSAVDYAFGGGGGGHRRRRSRGGGGYTEYNRMGNARPRGSRDDDRRGRRDRDDRGAFDNREFITETRVEAEEIIDNMYEIVGKYDMVTLRDLLSMLGEPHEYTDEDWGWMDLRGARIHRVGRDGYLIDLPRPVKLD